MKRAQTQQRLTKAESNQKTRRNVTNAAQRQTAIGAGPSQSPSLKVISANNGPLEHLLYLQGVVGNRAVGRLLQAKLAISQPGDPYEREADRVADTVMRMSEPALVEGEETLVQTKPLTPQITPLVQRESAQLPEEEEEKGVATSPLVQRIPVAVREDEEERVTPKLEPGAALQEEETPVQAKLETDAAIHRQAKQDEEPVSASSPSGAVQRFCATCAGEQQRQEGKPPEIAQRQPARYQRHDDHDEAERRLQPQGGDAVTPPVQRSVAANIGKLNSVATAQLLQRADDGGIDGSSSSEQLDGEPKKICGPNITKQLIDAQLKTRKTFAAWKNSRKETACQDLVSIFFGPGAWDIIQLNESNWILAHYGSLCASKDTTPDCIKSVQIDKECFYAGSVDYAHFGNMFDLCQRYYASAYPLNNQFTLNEMVRWIDLWKGTGIFGLSTPSANFKSSVDWAVAGFFNWPHAPTPQGDRSNCSPTCLLPYIGGNFDVNWSGETF
jgi:hypothetical protein